MENIMGFLILIALAGITFGLISAIVKKVKKKSVKKSLSLVGISFVTFIIAFASFPTSSDGQQHKGADQVAAVSNNTKDNILDDKLGEAKNISSESEQSASSSNDAEHIATDLWLEHTTDFSEGRAWVQFSETQRKKGSIDAITDAAEAAMGDDADRLLYGLQNYNPQGDYRAALINTNGQIIWESELTKSNTVLRKKSKFKDGLTYFIFDGNEKSSYNIIDSNGNVTFTRDYDENYQILGYGGGMFLVAEHTANFDSNEWKIGAIDKNGNIVVPFKAYEEMKSFDDNDYISCEYLGENIYALSFMGPKILLNIKAQSIIYNSESRESGDIRDFITNFENGAATVLYTKQMETGEYVCSLGTDGTITTIVGDDWARALTGNSDNTLRDGLIYLYYDGGYQGLQAFPVGAYYNLEGERVIDFPQYRGKNPYHCDPFYSGYAAMSINGADGLPYITVINKKGDLMFEPKTGFGAVYTSPDGKYVTAVTNGSITVFDINGNSLVSIKYGSISTESEYNVYDGIIKIGDFYVNVEDGTIIGLPGGSHSKFTVTLHKN